MMKFTNVFFPHYSNLDVVSRIFAGFLVFLGTLPLPVLALPSGAHGIQGATVHAPNGNTLTVDQQLQRAIVNWQDFSIGAGELVHFNQPGADASILNRVTGGNLSEIYGTLSANGQVLLLNPNGILVGASGIIDTHSFIASTLNINDNVFLNGGDLHFFNPEGDGVVKGTITNLGQISAQGGDLILIASRVENKGTLSAAQGTVGIAAGYDEVLLADSGNRRLLVKLDSGDRGKPEGNDGILPVNAAAADSSILNEGQIAAVRAELAVQGGNPLALALNNQGTIQATGTQTINGEVWLVASTGDMISSGDISAQNANDTGGKIVLQADRIAITDTAHINADGANGGGEILIGGSWQGKEDPAIRQATHTHIAKDAVLSASATENGDGGTIVVWSDVTNPESITEVNGNFLAQGGTDGGKGGRVETSGSRLQVGDLIRVSTLAPKGENGLWLLDPTNFTIATGTAAQSTSGIGATTLQNNLAGGSVTIQTATAGAETGHIYVNAPVTWNTNTLTLTAHGDIVVNALMTATGSAGIALNYGWNGNTGTPTYGNNSRRLTVHERIDLSGSNVASVAINGQAYTVLRTQAAVAGISNNLSGRYVLGGNLSFTGNWTPVGTSATKFTGVLDGLGNTISGLTVNHNASGAGLFGNTGANAHLANLRLVEVNVANSAGSVGALVGQAEGTTIHNAHASGTITSTATTFADAGGLVGSLLDTSHITYSSAHANVTGQERNIGGLVGYARTNSTISNSFATGTVTISGNQGNVGGLVGGIDINSTVTNTYATGNVTAQNNNTGNTGVGGLIGRIRGATVQVSNSYSSGTVTTNGGPTGGLIGDNADGTRANVTNSFWLDGLATSAGGTRITANHNNQATYTFVSFADNWTIVEGLSRPQLKAHSSDSFMVGKSLSIEQNASITIAQDISTISTLGTGTLTLKTQGDLVMNASRKIQSTGGKLNTILWSDSDANAGGHIYLMNGATITTNGGHLWMGGGSGTTTWNGLTVGNGRASGTAAGIDLTDATTGGNFGSGNRFHHNGITLFNSTITTNGGNFSALGTSAAYQNTGRGYIGIFAFGNFSISTTTGNLQFDGISNATQNNNSWYNGIFLSSKNAADNAQSTVSTTTGSLTLTGEINQDFAAGHPRAINLSAWSANTNKLTLSTTTGNISISGNNKNTQSHANNRAIGVDVDNRNLEISSTTGNITLTGTQSTAASGSSIGLRDTVIRTNGTVTVTADTANFATGTSFQSTGGTLIVKPLTAATTIGLAGGAGTLALPADFFATDRVSNGFAKLEIGATNAGAITVGADITSPVSILHLKSASGITATAGGIIATNLALTAGAVINFSDASTNVGTVAIHSTSGAISFLDSNALTLGTVDGVSGVTASAADVEVRTAVDNLTLSNAVTTTGTGNVYLAAGTNFINNAGSNAIALGTGRWLVYSTTPANNTFGNLVSGQKALWSKTYAANAPGGIAETGNRYLFSEMGAVTVTTTNGTAKTYDGNLPVVSDNYSLSGLPVNASTYGNVFVNAEASDIWSAAPTLSVASANAGTHTISGSGGTARTGFSLSFANNGTITINPKTLTVAGTTVANKTFDNTTDASFTLGTLSGFIGNETLVLSATGAFETAGVGSNKPVVINYSLANGTNGGLASNYRLQNAQQTLTANISAQTNLSFGDNNEVFTDSAPTAVKQFVQQKNNAYTNRNRGRSSGGDPRLQNNIIFVDSPSPMAPHMAELLLTDVELSLRQIQFDLELPTSLLPNLINHFDIILENNKVRNLKRSPRKKSNQVDVNIEL